MIVCLGSFDGYHRGHFSLFSAAAEMARQSGTSWRIVTFSPHPRFVLGGLTERLFTPQEKTLLRRCFGLPEPIRYPFTKEFASTEPGDFLDDLRSNNDVTGIVVGDHFHFGKNRKGNGEFLTRYCRENNVALRLMPQLRSNDGEVVSSTRVRELVGLGNFQLASELLGYPYFLTSEVIHGQRRGRGLGYPTANLYHDGNKLLPHEGVYACAMYHAGKCYPAAVSVGRNPTFVVEGQLSVEAHIIDFSGDLYGARPLLVFFKQLRQMTRYADSSALMRQLELDCAHTKEVYRDSASQLSVFKNLPEEL